MGSAFVPVEDTLGYPDGPKAMPLLAHGIVSLESVLRESTPVICARNLAMGK